MIPPDVASSLRLILPDQQSTANAQTLPVVAAQKIADVLSNLVPGQRVLAEIQALLPNGNYRAIVGQRDITLALPFAAKAGDSIELEVTESDGKLTLAFVANRTESAAAKVGQESVPTTFSSTAKLIGTLMSGIDGEGKRAPAAPLNGNQALVTTMPKNAAELAPVLKQALSQSGMFYEAHQAKWVAGQLPTEALRQEPQAKFSPLPITVAVNGVFEGKNPSNSNVPMSTLPGTEPLIKSQLATLLEPNALVQNKLNFAYNTSGAGLLQLPRDLGTSTAQRPEQAASAPPTNAQLPLGSEPQTLASAKLETGNTPQPLARANEQANASIQPGSPIPRELTSIVQQQLDGLASQNFAWQGQVWPGQQMWWEIGENPANAQAQDAETAQWQTRLKLSLPMLGGIDAVLQLRPNGEVAIAINTDTEVSETQLKERANQLRGQFESAGLSLSKLFIQHAQPAE